MTGRSIHNALLCVLTNGVLRTELKESGPLDKIPSEEQNVLRAISQDRLQRLSRFLARHYYRERIVRLFRHVRSLIPHTARDPLIVLESGEALAVLERAVLGSPQSAEEIVVLIERYLLEQDGDIIKAVPYWKDLVRYQATMFRVEATGTISADGRHPRRTLSARIIDVEWDLPAVVAVLRNPTSTPPSGEKARVSLLIARSHSRQITTVRCPKELRCLIESADGQRDAFALASLCGLSKEHTERMLQQLVGIGALDMDSDRLD